MEGAENSVDRGPGPSSVGPPPVEFKMKAKPHVSSAIVQLRAWVSVTSIALILALAAQLLVFGFVHYTDIRWTTVKADPMERPLMVVDGQPTSGLLDAGDAGPVRVPAQEARARGVREATAGKESTSAAIADVNRVLTGADRIMRAGTNLAMTFGVVAAITLAMTAWLGVAVAGGGAVPGVERAVTAATWSFVLLGLCLPLKDIMPTMPVPGVFSGYERLTAGSEAARAGKGSEGILLLLHVVLPAASIACAALVRYWFNEGVERGVIYTSMSEVDEAMEKEMAQISASGPNARMTRAMGALTRTMESPDDVPQAGPTRKAAGAESQTPALLRMRAADPDDFKRPI
jgi:hypothetical protein